MHRIGAAVAAGQVASAGHPGAERRRLKPLLLLLLLLQIIIKITMIITIIIITASVAFLGVSPPCCLRGDEPLGVPTEDSHRPPATDLLLYGYVLFYYKKWPFLCPTLWDALRPPGGFPRAACDRTEDSARQCIIFCFC